MSGPPIILVHGILDSGACFAGPRARLVAAGRTVYAPDLLPADGSQGLARLALQLQTCLLAVLKQEAATRVDLVCFSLGGLVARYLLQRLDGARHVQRFVTIASPHQGSYAAYSLNSPLGRELRPGSPFLADLAADWPATAAGLQTTAIWTPFDLIVLPGSRARVAHGTNVRVPTPRHSRMLQDTRIWQAVHAALEV